LPSNILNEKPNTTIATLNASLSEILSSGAGINETLALQMGNLSGPDIFSLLPLSNRLRRHFCGSEIGLCAITNAKSGRCPEDCAYCAQSIAYDTGVATFPLIDVAELAKRAREAADSSVENFSIVTSGTAVESVAEQEKIIEMLQEITGAGVAPCASLGFLDAATATRYHAAGLKHYHHNLETSRSFFKHICTTHDYDRAVATVKTAKTAGLYVCSGGIMGLGESWAQRVELALTLRELEVDSIPLNFLVPVSGTPLADESGLTPYQALLTIAMFRFVCPTVDIRICGGRQRTFGDFQSLIFAAGANGLMVGNYLTTSGRQWSDDQRLLADWRAFEAEAAGE
jgi:biotin synthase